MKSGNSFVALNDKAMLCTCPFKIHVVLNPHCDGIIKQGLWEVTESLGVYAHEWKACFHRGLRELPVTNRLCLHTICLLLALGLPSLQIQL